MTSANVNDYVRVSGSWECRKIRDDIRISIMIGCQAFRHSGCCRPESKNGLVPKERRVLKDVSR